MIMRLSYCFRFAGKEYSAIDAVVGETTNSRWFWEDGGEGGRFHKWGAIYHALPELHDALIAAGDGNTLFDDPGKYGFKFTLLES